MFPTNILQAARFTAAQVKSMRKLREKIANLDAERKKRIKQTFPSPTARWMYKPFWRQTVKQLKEQELVQQQQQQQKIL